MSARAKNKALLGGTTLASPEPRAASTSPRLSPRSASPRHSDKEWKQTLPPWSPGGSRSKSTTGVRESSKKQAERIRKEHMARTRDTHRKIFKNIDPNVAKGKQLREKEERERETREAEEAFAAMLKKQEEESLALINQWREEAKEKEKSRRLRAMALKWKYGTQEARILGPFSIPSKVDEADKMFDELRKTPRGAVAAFLLALFRKAYNRPLGNQMLSRALHPDCITPDGAVRKFTLKATHKIDSQILSSYAVAAHPQNGYSFNPNNIRFEFDNIHTPKVFEAKEGSTALVYLVTSGPLPTYPTSRPVEVKFTDGRWGVRTFLKLTMPVETGRARRHSMLEGEESDGGDDKFADYRHISRHDERESWTKAPDFAAIRRRKEARGDWETIEKKAERRSRAKEEVTGLAGRLATRDLKREWAEHSPRSSRRIVDGSGHVKEVTLENVDKVLGNADIAPEEDPEIEPVEEGADTNEGESVPITVTEGDDE
eukprot:m.101486 g.101486  ORF g.101486 m.101486 type:complete len:488 (+) comp10394_c0_seq1:58-1521(+)